jgi:hypothetical protein
MDKQLSPQFTELLKSGSPAFPGCAIYIAQATFDVLVASFKPVHSVEDPFAAFGAPLVLPWALVGFPLVITSNVQDGQYELRNHPSRPPIQCGTVFVENGGKPE